MRHQLTSEGYYDALFEFAFECCVQVCACFTVPTKDPFQKTSHKRKEKALTFTF